MKDCFIRVIRYPQSEQEFAARPPHVIRVIRWQNSFAPSFSFQAPES